VAILDMDGFRIKNEFRCKELGMLVLEEDPAIWSNLFYSADVILSMTAQDWRQHDFILKKNIYDIPITQRDSFSIKMEKVPEVVRDLYPGFGTVAYKGGHIEKDLLKTMGIPSLNIESLGCPKADVLAPMFPEARQCGLHNKGHCPRQEVILFAKWIVHAMEKQGMRPRYLHPRLCSPLETLPDDVYCKPLYTKIKL